jgi:ribonucleoside-diphosphate reductase alpha chain
MSESIESTLSSQASAKIKKEVKVTENARRVLAARYLKKNEAGELLETPEDLFYRVATTMADIEDKYRPGENLSVLYKEKFFDIMAEGYFMPNSPTLMNAGREMGMLSACFVLPLEDSISEIFSSVKATAMIQKAGGGTGFSFDKLRPTGDYITSSGGTTSGPISFWKVLSEATNAIQQGAFRRGANMGMMSITHPDILKFIRAKQDLTAFTNYNISVKVPDSWMESFLEAPDAAHILTNLRTGNNYVLNKSVNPDKYLLTELTPFDTYLSLAEAERPEVWTRQEIFDMIIDCAWKTGEPGLIFIDAINRANPTPNVGEIEATNPCGEQPLLPYEACNLGSVNLSKFVTYSPKGKTEYDWDSLKDCIHLSTRFLDNVIDANQYPLKEIEEMCLGNRKIGLGVMGFADTLFQLGIPYNSEEGLAFGEQIMRFLNDESHAASESLAQERGNFPNWQGSLWDTQHNRAMRNSTTTTIAPTGTISIIANCSGGIEPMFSLAFFRNVLDGQRLTEVNHIFEKTAREGEFYSKELVEGLAEKGSLSHIDGVPEDIKRIYVCSHDIAPDWHVRMQAAFQKHCDSSISKTINLPREANRTEVENIYKKAWKLKCKGVTVYRDGCRDSQPMALSGSNKKAADAPKIKREPSEWVVRKPIKTPSILSAVRIRQNTPFGHMHVTISLDPKTSRDLEVFAQLGKAGDVAMSDLEAISRLISLYLRLGGSLPQIIDQLEGIGSHMSIPTRDGRIMSLADALGKTLRKYINAKNAFGVNAILCGDVDFDALPGLKEVDANSEPQVAFPKITAGIKNENMMQAFKVKCPECNDGVLSFSEGCVKCPMCGYSRC